MKKLLAILCALLLVLFIFTVTALAEADPDLIDYDQPGADITSEGPDDGYIVTTTLYGDAAEPQPITPGEPLTWAYLATIAGATAATLLIVQYFKAKLDKVWKMPTRVFVYVVALVIQLLATHFTKGLTVDTAILTVINAFVVAAAAYGAYEITFKKLEH